MAIAFSLKPPSDGDWDGLMCGSSQDSQASFDEHEDEARII